MNGNDDCKESDPILPSLQSQKGRHHQPSPRFSMKTMIMLLIASVCLTWSVLATTASSSSPAPKSNVSASVVSAYTAPSFPTSAFSSYYNDPTGTSVEPRPIITEYNSGRPFPSKVDQPYPLPTGPPSSDAVYPDATVKAPANISSQIQSQIISIINNSSLGNCQKCVQSLQAGQKLAHANPESIPGVLIDLCTMYNFTSTKSGLNQSESCKRMYSGSILGSQYSQILSYANLKETNESETSDSLYICSLVIGSKTNCSTPAPIDLNHDGFLDKWFGGKAKREERKVKEHSGLSKRSGPPHLDARGEKKMMKVLHVSRRE